MSIEFPQFFRYERAVQEYGPLVVEALATLRRSPVHEGLRPHIAWQVWDNPRPSYLILPFLFLASGESTGALRPAHLEFLPSVLLMAELLAVADDSVDRTPFRSDRPSFPTQFGDGSAVPFVSNLVSRTLDAARPHPAVFQALTRCYDEFFSLELWERSHTYPDRARFPEWLRNRYQQTIVINTFILDAGRLLGGAEAWPRDAIAALGRIQQDVDDVVNVVEYRAAAGENDDFLAGVVTRPLMLALQAVPELDADVRVVWDRFRPLAADEPSIAELHARRTRAEREVLPTFRRIRDALLAHGVPGTIEGVREDQRRAIAACSVDQRPFMKEFCETFVGRLLRCRAVEPDERTQPAAK